MRVIQVGAAHFDGWPIEALAFYRGLEVDNSKGYWEAHRSVYEVSVLAPMQALLEDLAAEFGESKIFRPYRDVRFSADKSPYKTAIGATLSSGGYVHLSASGLSVGAGNHLMAPDQLERYRLAVDNAAIGQLLAAAVGRLQDAGVGITSGDSLKTVPRGYDKEHPRAELLRHKGLAAWKDLGEPAWLHTAEAEVRVADVLRASKPLTDWLDANVGPSTSMRTR
jgi:uncharacterized protein (TIGR02453 family)